MSFARALVRSRVIVTTLAAITAVALSLAFFHGDAKGGSTYRFKPTEKCLMRKVNRARANRGLRKLGWDKQVGYVARRHARKMARYGSVWHDNHVGEKVTRWYSLGQNTGRSSSCRRIFRKFWNSSMHRKIILGKWRYMGAGTKWSNGRLYVQHIFETRRDPGNIWGYPDG